MTIDTTTAAVACGVDQRTIRRWVETGKLTNYGTAKRIRVSLGELNRALATDVR